MQANTYQVKAHCESLKQRFIQAIKKGEIGSMEERGIIVTIKEFKLYFSDIKKEYTATFLPASTIEPGRTYITRTKFLFRLKTGVYLLHPDALKLTL